MLAGFLLLILFQWLGECLVSLAGLPVPGPVAGMLLLFCALLLRSARADAQIPPALAQVSDGLVRYLSLFFLPAGVGIFFLPAAFDGQWWPLLLVIVPGTLLALLVTSLLLRALLRRVEGAGHSGQRAP